MKIILFLILWMIPFLGGRAFGAVEIYVDGHKYSSFEAYKASKVHTIVIAQNLSESTRHKLYVLSVENGFINALKDSYHMGSAGIPLPRQISPEQLQAAIQEAVTESNDPKLLISTPGKVRLMTLTGDDNDKSLRLAAGQ